ncbi:MAG: trypsin-like peptidase domain-containing protein [Planctomycetaceae bacterium]
MRFEVADFTALPTDTRLELDFANDWVLLTPAKDEPHSAGFRTSKTTQLPYTTDPDTGAAYTAIGYAGGNAKFRSRDKDMAEMRVHRSDAQALRIENNGLGDRFIRLTPRDTARGMSGGPVVNQNGEVVALHRAGYSDWICTEASRLSAILQDLSDRGCVVVPAGKFQPEPRRRWLMLTVAGLLVAVLLAAFGFLLSDHGKRPEIKYAELYNYLRQIADEHDTNDWDTARNREKLHEKDGENQKAFRAVVTYVSAGPDGSAWEVQCSPATCEGVAEFDSALALTLPDELFPTHLDRSALEPIGNKYRIVLLSVRIEGFAWDPGEKTGIVYGVVTDFQATDEWITCSPAAG